MPRLIEVQDAAFAATPVRLQAGDILLLRAAGAHVVSGADCIDNLGPFRSAVLGDNGEVFSPMGLPDAVLLRAGRPGRAAIGIVIGRSFPVAGNGTLLHVAIEG